ncbi:embryogenesis-like protein [Nymphaea colorata]|uniref:Uncharacterized protein n=1 Tax=Nymphaea colorata TaxID=210225 RepID=A0A5K0ZFL7_9MAGN|nr:embryogenesis-like protein [Nymphaea colorata]
MTLLSRIPLRRSFFACHHRSIPRFLDNHYPSPQLLSPETPSSRTPISFPSDYSPRTRVFNSTHTSILKNYGGLRRFSNETDRVDYEKEVDEINLKFVEAREEIDLALEAKDTVYFNQEADTAREAVKVVIDMFEDLSARLPEHERRALNRSMGLKMEQLKAELEQLNE